jgi:hypothetical protein
VSGTGIRVGRAVTLALVVAALGACGGDKAQPASAAPPAPPLTVEIVRDRLFDVTGTFQLTFGNHGRRPVQVTGVELRSALYEPLGASDRVTTIDPGRQVSVPLHHGAVRCGPGLDDDLTIHFAVDGRATSADAGPASPAIHRIHDAGCAEAAIRDAADIGFADDWHTVDGTRAVGTISVRARATTSVSVEQVSTAIVFVSRVTTPLPSLGDIGVDATAARCDAHALTESKKTFTFVLDVRVDGGPPARLELRATDGPVLRAMADAIKACVAARG